jgi:hypothetical protein
MSSIHDLNQKVLLFVGRPTDSRKGLAVLFEAVEILTTLSDLPKFDVWVVGGSPREVGVVSRMVDCIDSLRSLRSDGRVRLWGRVENPALSELYSRACVTVVPSYREEFGIVAVEAMMSGCPVVAAKTGGLADIVREGETGVLFEAGDAPALAASLCGYLRNPGQHEMHRAAAKERAAALFSSRRTLGRIAEVYISDTLPEADITQWEQTFYERELTRERLERLKAVFADDPISVMPETAGKHAVFRVSVDDNSFVAKFFTSRFSLQASLFTNPLPFSFERGGSVSYHRVLYNKDNPVSPPVRHFGEAPEPFVVMEWRPQFSEPQGDALDAAVNNAFRHCQQWGASPDRPGLAEYTEALGAFAAAPNDSRLAAFDVASARLNSSMTGGRMILSRTHPQVELARFRTLLNNRAWPTPEGFKVRATQTINLLLESVDFVVGRPLLAHGDPKPEHLLTGRNGEVLLADFEHSRYAVGPLDLALWLILTGARNNERGNARDVCERIRAHSASSEESYMAACWVVAEVIFFTLQRFTAGDSAEMERAQNFLKDMGMAVLNSGIIR